MMIYDIVYAIHEDRLGKGTSLPLLQSQDKHSQVPFKTHNDNNRVGYQLIRNIQSAPQSPFPKVIFPRVKLGLSYANYHVDGLHSATESITKKG